MSKEEKTEHNEETAPASLHSEYFASILPKITALRSIVEDFASLSNTADTPLEDMVDGILATSTVQIYANAILVAAVIDKVQNQSLDSRPRQKLPIIKRYLHIHFLKNKGETNPLKETDARVF